MSRESIQKIKETEERAEQLVEEARRLAQERIALAEQEGRALCEQTERETNAAVAAMLAQLYERTEAMSQRLDEEAKEEADKMRADASLRKRSAEKIVIRGLTSKCR